MPVGPADAEPPAREARAGGPMREPAVRDQGIQAAQTSGCSSIQILAASSALLPPLVMRSATWFWSAFVQLKFLISV